MAAVNPLVHIINPLGHEVLRFSLSNPLNIKRQLEHLQARAGPYTKTYIKMIE